MTELSPATLLSSQFFSVTAKVLNTCAHGRVSRKLRPTEQLRNVPVWDHFKPSLSALTLTTLQSFEGDHGAGRSRITAELRNGSQRDAILFAVGANAQHGHRRSNADKRRAVETLLKDEEWSAMSDRAVAKQCGVGNKMVGDLRRELCPEHSCAASDTHRVGLDGKARALPKASPLAKEPEAQPRTDDRPAYHERTVYEPADPRQRDMFADPTPIDRARQQRPDRERVEQLLSQLEGMSAASRALFFEVAHA